MKIAFNCRNRKVLGISRRVEGDLGGESGYACRLILELILLKMAILSVVLVDFGENKGVFENWQNADGP